jgi:hypothetical protein
MQGPLSNWPAQHEALMLGWFRALMPKQERFFELFVQHAQLTLAGAEALRALLSGTGDPLRCSNDVYAREHEADEVTRNVLTASTILHHSARSRRHQGPHHLDGRCHR